jgi:L-asparaginase II
VGVLLAEVTRRDVRTGDEVVESRHLGHAVVTDVDGGSRPRSVTRSCRPSCARPRSRSRRPPASSCSTSPAGRRAPPELAVAWASHRGEERHVDAVRRLLRRSATPPEQLTCPPAAPEADPGATPHRLWHNCSGKHALFALAGQHQGTSHDRLLDPDGPLQRVVLGVLEEVLGPLAAVGVDGCGAPAVEAPLAALARGYAALAVDDRFARVREAGLAHPGLVGGEGRLESALLGAGVVAKVGAEGVYAAGWVDAPAGRTAWRARRPTGRPGAWPSCCATPSSTLGVVPADVWSPEPPLGGGRPAGTVRAVPAATEALVAGLRGAR